MRNLILQAGQDLFTQDLKAVAKLVSASGIQAINQRAFRLLNVQEDRAAVAAYCEPRQIDWAYVPAGLKLADIGLVVMDMDSTLITIECIDEIADMQGIKAQVSAITEAAMRGELDFQQSLTRRVALLEGLDASALQRVYDERLRLSPGAETMLAKLHAAGARSLLVSGGFTFFTERLQQRLHLSQTIANTLEIVDGKLTGKVLGPIIDARAKLDHLQSLRSELGLKPDQVIALGDGANDLQMLAEAGIGIAYHAKPIVRQQAQYALTFVGLDGLLNWFES